MDQAPNTVLGNTTTSSAPNGNIMSVSTSKNVVSISSPSSSSNQITPSQATPISQPTPPQSTNSVTAASSSAIVTPTSSAAIVSSATSTPAAQISQSSTPIGLIAGVAVLGALLALALIAIAFLWSRRRRNRETRENYAGSYETKGVPDNSIAVAGLESNIAALETQLQQKDSQLKERQAALLQYGRRAGGNGLSDKQVYERFARLNKSINDWTVTHFKNIRVGTVPAPDVEATVQAVFPHYSMLLQDPRTKYLVFRGLVAEVIFRALATGELLNNPAFSELRQAISSSCSPTEANEWRSMTATLLEKTPGYRTDMDSSVQELSSKIDYMTSNLAGLGNSGTRLNHLREVVEAAAALALDIAKERSIFKVEKPTSSTFDAASMEDALQDHPGEALQGRPIEGIVFPIVLKQQDGEAGENTYTIGKSQVLVHA